MAPALPVVLALGVLASLGRGWLVPWAGRALSAVGLIGPGLARWDDPLRRPATWGDLARLVRVSRVYGWAVQRGFLRWPASSGFRAPALNATLRAASPTSLHLVGLAADGPTVNGDSYATAYALRDAARKEGKPVQEVGWYTTGHVHIGLARLWTKPAYRVFAGGAA